MSQKRIRIAIQKNGRMASDSLSLLKKCGLHVAKAKDQLLCRIEELPIDLLMVRDDDIPTFVNKGICDLGIVGENVFAEEKLSNKDFSVTILERLGFSKCRLSMAAPENGKIKNIKDLNGKIIATTYPALCANFAKENNLNIKTLEMSGSVEVAPRLKIADAICDIVSSGATLSANNLYEMKPILKSEALLIRGKENFTSNKEEIIDRLLSRMRGTLKAEDSKYIMLHANKKNMKSIIKLLPGSESPTILPLQGKEDKVAIHAVCQETIFWETMEQLKESGASSVLVLPIEKMMGV